MQNTRHYIFESILDDFDAQDNAVSAAGTFADALSDEQLPDPYEADDYDFELYIDTPMIRLKKREKIVALVTRWLENVETVMTSLRQAVRCTRPVFYSRSEQRIKNLVGDAGLIREPLQQNMYGTGIFLRFDHRFTTGQQILKFIARLTLCVASLEQLREDRRGDVHLRVRYYRNGGDYEDVVLSYVKNIVEAVVFRTDISKYQNIDPTLMDTVKFAFNLLHRTQEYKYNVYNSIRARLYPGKNLADWGAYLKVKNVFGEPDTVSKRADGIITAKKTADIQSLLKFEPYRLVDGMIFPFAATYVLKDLEYDGGFIEYELTKGGSYGNGRRQIQNSLIIHNDGSTVLP